MNESASLQVDAGDARLSYHRTGSGPPLLPVPGARLLVHEEKPEIVAARAIEFFGREEPRARI